MKMLKRWPLFLFLISIFYAHSLHSQDRSKPVQLIEAARTQIGVTLLYDPTYLKLNYPGGDPPADRGVCTDVLIRAFREVGVDLQVLVNQDMRKDFSSYPNIWGLKSPDTNIDHRRVPNLMVFFERSGKKMTSSSGPTSFLPGDIVTWRLDNGLPHIGIVSDRRSADLKRRLVIHNIGRGTQEEDMLQRYEITGHYRYFQSNL